MDCHAGAIERTLHHAGRSDPPGDLRAAVPRRRADGVDADRRGRRVAAGGVKASRRAQERRPGARPPRRTRDPLPRAAQSAGATDRLDESLRRVLARPLRSSRIVVEKDGSVSNPETLSVTVERDMPYPPEKIWRALTQPHLIAEWLMRNDFEPVVGRQFSLRMDPQPNWNGVIDCQVLVVEPNKTLSYAWG